MSFEEEGHHRAKIIMVYIFLHAAIYSYQKKITNTHQHI